MTMPPVRRMTATRCVLTLALTWLSATTSSHGVPLGVAGVPSGPASRAHLAPSAERTRALYGTLTLSALLVLVFLVGSYVMIRAGRAMLARPRRPRPTEYVDAWSHYRLREEQPPDTKLPEQGGDQPGAADDT